jgi:hypothetical protein
MPPLGGPRFAHPFEGARPRGAGRRVLNRRQGLNTAAGGDKPARPSHPSRRREPHRWDLMRPFAPRSQSLGRECVKVRDLRTTGDRGWGRSAEIEVVATRLLHRLTIGAGSPSLEGRAQVRVSTLSRQGRRTGVAYRHRCWPLRIARGQHGLGERANGRSGNAAPGDRRADCDRPPLPDRKVHLCPIAEMRASDGTAQFDALTPTTTLMAVATALIATTRNFRRDLGS